MSDEIWVSESPKHYTEGDAPVLSVTYNGATTVTTVGASMAVYKNGAGSDLSATLCSGSLSASGNILSLKTITFGASTGGNDYVVVITATIDGVVEVRKLMCVVQKAKARQ